MKVIRLFISIMIVYSMVCGNDAMAEEKVQFNPDTNYLETMIDCCVNGEIEAGRKAAKLRDAKIDAMELQFEKIDFDELNELSKIITLEAGSSWLPYNWKMSVGEVVLNRVASPEFPNTLYDVIHQNGQYSAANSKRFTKTKPYYDCANAAAELLSGERVINDAAVVFQSQKKQGGGVCVALYDNYYGYTYFCYSSHPELYK